MLRGLTRPVASGTSPAAPGSAQLVLLTGLKQYDLFTLDLLVQGATGGTLDLYLQRLVDPAGSGIWADWARLTQLAAAAAQKLYSLTFDTNGVAPAITNLGTWTTAGAGTVVLAAGSVAAVHPGDQLRLWAVAGSGTTVGAAQSVYVTGLERYT